MACIVYKDGKPERVAAELVAHMLENGYTSSPKKAAKPAKKPAKSLDNVDKDEG